MVTPIGERPVPVCDDCHPLTRFLNWCGRVFTWLRRRLLPDA